MKKVGKGQLCTYIAIRYNTVGDNGLAFVIHGLIKNHDHDEENSSEA